jgi:hypothetical protein
LTSIYKILNQYKCTNFQKATEAKDDLPIRKFLVTIIVTGHQKYDFRGTIVL